MCELNNQYSLTRMGSVQSADLHDLHKKCFSVGVIDLQDLYNLQNLYDLPEWNLSNLNDLYLFIRFGGSV